MKKIEKLILFTRYPQAGVTKTRLIPALGSEGAADLQRRMTAHAAAQAERLAQSRGVSVEVRFEGGTAEKMRAWLGEAFDYHRQGPGDIGVRMRTALAVAFSSGAARAVLIGSDIPAITADILATAFDRLKSMDIVLGPARDGGYYLVGIRQTAWSRAAEALFAAMPWGSSRVLAATRQKIGVLGYQVHMLETLADIDRPEDIVVWEQSFR